jgi:hypothetical protein
MLRGIQVTQTVGSLLHKSRICVRRPSFVRTLFASTNPTSDYSSLEYPFAKEPPEISKTIAAQIRGQAPKLTKDLTPPGASTANDPASDVSEARIRQLQSQELSPGVSAITPEIPSEIPPNVPASQLETPETLITQLDNGVRVVR